MKAVPRPGETDGRQCMSSLRRLARSLRLMKGLANTSCAPQASSCDMEYLFEKPVMKQAGTEGLMARSSSKLAGPSRSGMLTSIRSTPIWSTQSRFEAPRISGSLHLSLRLPAVPWERTRTRYSCTHRSRKNSLPDCGSPVSKPCVPCTRQAKSQRRSAAG